MFVFRLFFSFVWWNQKLIHMYFFPDRNCLQSTRTNSSHWNMLSIFSQLLELNWASRITHLPPEYAIEGFYICGHFFWFNRDHCAFVYRHLVYILILSWANFWRHSIYMCQLLVHVTLYLKLDHNHFLGSIFIVEEQSAQALNLVEIVIITIISINKLNEGSLYTTKMNGHHSKRTSHKIAARSSSSKEKSWSKICGAKTIFSSGSWWLNVAMVLYSNIFTYFIHFFYSMI